MQNPGYDRVEEIDVAKEGKAACDSLAEAYGRSIGYSSVYIPGDTWYHENIPELTEAWNELIVDLGKVRKKRVAVAKWRHALKSLVSLAKADDTPSSIEGIRGRLQELEDLEGKRERDSAHWAQFAETIRAYRGFLQSAEKRLLKAQEKEAKKKTLQTLKSRGFPRGQTLYICADYFSHYLSKDGDTLRFSGANTLADVNSWWQRKVKYMKQPREYGQASRSMGQLTATLQKSYGLSSKAVHQACVNKTEVVIANMIEEQRRNDKRAAKERWERRNCNVICRCPNADKIQEFRGVECPQSDCTSRSAPPDDGRGGLKSSFNAFGRTWVKEELRCP